MLAICRKAFQHEDDNNNAAPLKQLDVLQHHLSVRSKLWEVERHYVKVQQINNLVIKYLRPPTTYHNVIVRSTVFPFVPVSLLQRCVF